MAQIKIISNTEPLKIDKGVAESIKKQWKQARETGQGLDTVVDVDDCCFSFKDIRWISLKNNAGDSQENASEKKEKENTEYYKKIKEDGDIATEEELKLSPAERSNLLGYFKYAYISNTGQAFKEIENDKIEEITKKEYVRQNQERYFTKYPDRQFIDSKFALAIIEKLI